MNTVEELFQKSGGPERVRPGAAAQRGGDRLTVEEETRGVEVSLRCGELLTAGALQQGEESLRKSSLNLGRVRLLPHYAPELFSGAHVPELLQQLKRQDATLNGTFLRVLDGVCRRHPDSDAAPRRVGAAKSPAHGAKAIGHDRRTVFGPEGPGAIRRPGAGGRKRRRTD